MYFLIHPQGWIYDERMAIHCIQCIATGRYELGFTPPPTSRFSSALEMSLGLGPGKSLDCPNTPLLSAVYEYNFMTHLKFVSLKVILKDVCDKQIGVGSHFTLNAQPFHTFNRISTEDLMLRKTFIL